MRDYKEVWTDAFTEATARGLDEYEATVVADGVLLSWYVSAADSAVLSHDLFEETKNENL
jgi:hypothetical protein